MRIAINGRDVDVVGPTISYDALVMLAGKRRGVSVTVSYPREVDKRDRAPAPGQSVDVVEGMRVTAIYTGGA